MAIAKIIKYEGDNSTFIWKHPTVDFNNMTQLIVYESQEAVFMMNGMIMDTFGPGKYNLDTESLPILGKLVDTLVYGDSSFTADVYFINQTVQMALKWGTSPKVRFIEPNTGIPLEIGASGNLNLRVKDSKKLLIKLVGTTAGIAWDKDVPSFTKSLQDSFRPLINTIFKANFAPIVKENNINIIEIDQHVETLAKPMHERINTGFEEYGLSVVDFYITDIVLPEEDRNFKRIKDIMASSYLGVKEAELEATLTAARRAVELEQQQTLTAKKQMELQRDILSTQAEAQKTNIMAEAEANKARLEGFAQADVMAAQGYNQKDVLQAEVQKAYAEGMGNFGSNGSGGGGGIVSDMMSMQMGMMAANAMSGQMKEMMNGFTGTQNNSQTQPQSEEKKIYCPNCGTPLPLGAKFCMNCGQQISVNSKCPNCGSDFPAGAKFCPNCGTKIGE
ncbi:MAG: SPFH domain-containing protein [Erysipelotrichaceae bacterium]|nr:SPFH domain-containing protein [Erysipelotrichaceae bacterium]